MKEFSKKHPLRPLRASAFISNEFKRRGTPSNTEVIICETGSQRSPFPLY